MDTDIYISEGIRIEGENDIMKKWKKLLSLLFCAMMLFLVQSQTVSATGTEASAPTDLDCRGTSVSGSGSWGSYDWNSDTRTLTLSNITITGTVTLPDGNDGAVTVVTDGASQIGGISITTSGGKNSVITVNGKLAVREEVLPSAAISCSQLTIGSTGVLNISGEEGVQVNSSDAPAFKIAYGGRFSANCSAYSVEIYSSSSEVPDSAIDIPEGYLPQGYAI